MAALGQVGHLRRQWYKKFSVSKEICLNFGPKILFLPWQPKSSFRLPDIYAEVVTFVAGSLEAGGLPGSLEILVVLK